MILYLEAGRIRIYMEIWLKPQGKDISRNARNSAPGSWPERALPDGTEAIWSIKKEDKNLA